MEFPSTEKCEVTKRLTFSLYERGVLGIQQIKVIGIPKHNNRDFETWKLVQQEYLLKVNPNKQSPLVWVASIFISCLRCAPNVSHPFTLWGLSMAPHPKPSKIWQTSQQMCLSSTNVTPSGKGLSFHMSNSLGWDSWEDNMFFRVFFFGL
jgi:hypothetical protein